jgi:D-alanyl-D-alanine carboxypeptidase/D-alanyl-D-alanine-endopeptidase (penicillin-binding protein 4)
VQQAWKQFQQNEIFKRANVSLSVQRCDNQEFLLKENAKALSPASNLKLVTTATALCLLGKEYRYETLLFYSGTIKGDTLEGDLILQGNGDPSLASERLPAPYATPDSLMRRWALAVKAAGIQYIKGNLLLDLSAYEYNPYPDYWPWGDLGNYYGAGIYALNFYDNLFRVFFDGGKQEGDPARVVKMYPDPGFLQLENQVLSGPKGSGDDAYLYSSPWSQTLFMKGTIPAESKNFAVRGSIPSPPMLVGNRLIAELAYHKIKFQSDKVILNYKGLSPRPSTVLYTYYSPPIREIAKLTNVYSLNLYAECLLRTLGKKFGKEGSTSEGARVVKEFWKSKGLDVQGWHMQDGSGLSFNNAISTAQLCWILSFMKKESCFLDFYATLPVAGVSGTVYKLGKGSSLAGNGRIKSGSLSHVSCYSGYISSSDGVMLSVALFTNQYEGSAGGVLPKMEDVLKQLAMLKVK